MNRSENKHILSKRQPDGMLSAEDKFVSGKWKIDRRHLLTPFQRGLGIYVRNSDNIGGSLLNKSVDRLEYMANFDIEFFRNRFIVNIWPETFSSRSDKVRK